MNDCVLSVDQTIQYYRSTIGQIREKLRIVCDNLNGKNGKLESNAQVRYESLRNQFEKNIKTCETHIQELRNRISQVETTVILPIRRPLLSSSKFVHPAAGRRAKSSSPVVYVNERQYVRIVKRRQARNKLRALVQKIMAEESKKQGEKISRASKKSQKNILENVQVRNSLSIQPRGLKPASESGISKNYKTTDRNLFS